jgi:hypothetical protein
MEANGRLDIGHRLLIRFALPDHRILEAKWISYVAVGVFLDNDLEWFR